MSYFKYDRRQPQNIFTNRESAPINRTNEDIQVVIRKDQGIATVGGFASRAEKYKLRFRIRGIRVDTMIHEINFVQVLVQNKLKNKFQDGIGVKVGVTSKYQITITIGCAILRLGCGEEGKKTKMRRRD
jgi:hypothetical protein